MVAGPCWTFELELLAHTVSLADQSHPLGTALIEGGRLLFGEGFGGKTLVYMKQLLFHLKVVLSKGFIFIGDDSHLSVIGLPVPLLRLSTLLTHSLLVIVRLD
jgi:hypothetical protein